VLPIKAKRTCNQQRKWGKVSTFLTELKAYIVYAVRRKKRKRFPFAVPPW